MRAGRRKEVFTDQISDCENIHSVEGPKRGVITVRSESGKSTIYTHYGESFNFWGIAQMKTKNLKSRKDDLYHVFLGPKKSQYYLVPDRDLHSGDFNLPVQNKNGSNHWKLELGHGNPPNGSILQNYTDLCKWF